MGLKLAKKKKVKMEFSVLVRMCGNRQFKVTGNFANVVQINKHFEKQYLDRTT